ncbi:hypothetical protein [Flavisphingomonas formosensis]|uniref:hypothetical protein n=1 Tax=Flavisphingomonas formosensis TaxID=861534 RepID=UPI0018DF8422|nr:hypothetical protein [Sphingomonas formosensis]
MGAIGRVVTLGLATGGGILCIILGYRLYILGIRSDIAASGKHKGISASIKMAGPGAALALFGCWILSYVVLTQAHFTETTVKPATVAANDITEMLAYPVSGGPAGAATVRSAKPAAAKAPPCPRAPAGQVVITRTADFMDGGPITRERIHDASALAVSLFDEARARSDISEKQDRHLLLARQTMAEIARQTGDDK